MYFCIQTNCWKKFNTLEFQGNYQNLFISKTSKYL